MMVKNTVAGAAMALVLAGPVQAHDGHDPAQIAVEVQSNGADELLLEVTNNGAQPVVIMGAGAQGTAPSALPHPVPVSPGGGAEVVTVPVPTGATPATVILDFGPDGLLPVPLP
ncbi:hypothetical protein ACFTOW_02470 [Lacimonas salitolerans]|uniref:Uncharacterized protein n=2 Tax=Lacimonas salitolerans TaxID=1323750 RepID=A0ABW4EDT6_9RHOB